MQRASRPILPLSSTPSSPSRTHTYSTVPHALIPRGRTRQRLIFGTLVSLVILLLLNHRALGTFRRDLIYLLRPIWDTPEPVWNRISHFPPPERGNGDVDVEKWCRMHGWQKREERPTIVDAILLSTELDMLEIRMREYLPFVSTFIIVEADMTFSGDSKPLYFAQNKIRFDKIVAGIGAKIVYHSVAGLLSDRASGSFENEYSMRVETSRILSSLDLPKGSLVIQSDVDEILSRQTLSLLASCSGYPSTLHLDVDNYRYGFTFPLHDGGYWRPHVLTTGMSDISYHHGRGSNDLLEGAGWHCSFCFPTIEEMKIKMLGYSHNDRVRDPAKLLDPDKLKKRVCRGEDPFDMWPEAFTFRDIFARSGPTRPSLDFSKIPIAVRDDPTRFGYLLDKGCDRTA